MKRNICFLALSFLCSLLLSCAQKNPFVYQNGDIVFQESASRQSPYIAKATKSPYTHMGLVYVNNGAVYVYEAAARVKLTPLKTWIAQGRKKAIVVKRLRAPLREEDRMALEREGNAFYGKPYDILFQWSDEKIYCSELVWKIYRNALGVSLCPLKTMRDYDLEAVTEEAARRYGQTIPLAERVVAPVDIFNSELLDEVYRNYTAR